MLPYFKRSERNERGGDALHGDDGPLDVSDLRYSNPLSQAFIEAASRPAIRSTATSTARAGRLRPVPGHAEGRRALLGAVAYLDPVRERRNLTIVTGAQVNRITFERGRANPLLLQLPQPQRAASRRSAGRGSA